MDNLKWTKGLCPLCSEPTGCKSRCFELPEADNAELKQQIHACNRRILPLYSPDCIFRVQNIWILETASPVTDSFIAQILEIPGVVAAEATNKYSLSVIIANLFNEEEVKKEIALAYNNLKPEETIEITFPNGKSYVAKSPHEVEIIKQLTNDFGEA